MDRLYFNLFCTPPSVFERLFLDLDTEFVIVMKALLLLLRICLFNFHWIVSSWKRLLILQANHACFKVCRHLGSSFWSQLDKSFKPAKSNTNSSFLSLSTPPLSNQLLSSQWLSLSCPNNTLLTITWLVTGEF